MKLTSAFHDPIRRFHILFRIIESLIGIVAVLVLCDLFRQKYLSVIVYAVIIGIFLEFVVYEYVLEPISKRRVRKGKSSLVGPYWERGPQDGEQFKRQ